MNGADALVAFAALHALVATVFTGICVAAVLVAARRRERARGAEAPMERVFVLRPVDRPGAAWAARVAGEAAALAPATTIVAGTGLAALRAVLEPSGVRIVESDPPADAPHNRKVRHLDAAAGFARASTADARAVLVQVDADVSLSLADVRALVTTLAGAGPNDLAFAFPGAPRSAALARAILMGSPQSFAVVDALARITGGAPAIAGKCVALRASTLDAIGGHAAIQHAIGDDVALVERITAAGGRVHASARAVTTIDDAPASSASSALVARMTRWLRVIRAQRPLLLVTYPFLVAPLPIATALAVAAALVARTPWPVAPLAALIAARVALAASLARGPYRAQRPVGALVSPVLAAAGDAVLLLAWARALVAGRITWAGRVYDVGPGGRIRGVRSL